MTTTLDEDMTIVSPHWDMTARTTDGSTPSVQAQIDAEFERVVSPYMVSSGWLCTLTIECGTLICACR
ncbi:hypothetical protein [Microbacterium sp. Yaish 1]|uniref:hypothetical protein n=1 Tax=Microbacterium sp. Yaish 1 TaxID=2025014 RepID=UPI000B93B18A|nr:hypothetical protein [Microbacterium sp. Yaish 1]OYC95643.1 hypothetical protein CI089_13235 [Microbacterium sp. Yaish 1]